MAGIFELLKGDILDLRGRVILFSKVTGDMDGKIPPSLANPGVEIVNEINRKSKLISMYSTVDIDDFCERFSQLADHKETLKEDSEIMRARMRREGVRLYLPVVSAPVYYPSIDEIMKEDADVLFAGEWKSVSGSLFSLNSAGSWYGSKYSEQNVEVYEMERDITEALPQKRFGEYMQVTGLSMLINVAESGEKRGLEKLKERIKKAVKGKNYERDALRICDMIQIGKNIDHCRLVAYASKVEAIENERYERAAQLRDIIKLFEKLEE